MSDDKAEATVARLDNCIADLKSDYPVCERCGFAWRGGGPSPACKPMGLNRMVEVLEREIERLEQSHRVCVALKKEGVAADPLPELVRSAELRVVLRLVNRIRGSDAVLDILNPQRRTSNG